MDSPSKRIPHVSLNHLDLAPVYKARFLTTFTIYIYTMYEAFNHLVSGMILQVRGSTSIDRD